VRGFPSEAEALAWIIEQDKAEARRLAVSAAKVRPASELIFRNHELLRQGERAQHRYRQLRAPSLLCGFPFHTDDCELIRRNRALLAQAADLRSQTQEAMATAETAIQGSLRALIASELRRMRKKVAQQFDPLHRLDEMTLMSVSSSAA
jgi:hypothetical protein